MCSTNIIKQTNQVQHTHHDDDIEKDEDLKCTYTHTENRLTPPLTLSGEDLEDDEITYAM